MGLSPWETTLIVIRTFYLQALNAKCPWGFFWWSVPASQLQVNVKGNSSFFFAFHHRFFHHFNANTSLQGSLQKRQQKNKQVILLMWGVCFNLEECHFTPLICTLKCLGLRKLLLSKQEGRQNVDQYPRNTPETLYFIKIFPIKVSIIDHRNRVVNHRQPAVLSGIRGDYRERGDIL